MLRRKLFRLIWKRRPWIRRLGLWICRILRLATIIPPGGPPDLAGPGRMTPSSCEVTRGEAFSIVFTGCTVETFEFSTGNPCEEPVVGSTLVELKVTLTASPGTYPFEVAVEGGSLAKLKGTVTVLP